MGATLLISASASSNSIACSRAARVAYLPAIRRLDAQRKVRDWYWASVFTSRYSGSVESTAARDFQDGRSWIEDATEEPVISDRLPNEYLPELIANNGEQQVRDILASHFVSDKAFDIPMRAPFTGEDFEAFISERHRTIQAQACWKEWKPGDACRWGGTFGALAALKIHAGQEVPT